MKSSPVVRCESAPSATKAACFGSKFSRESTSARPSPTLHDKCSRLRIDVPTSFPGPSNRRGVAAPPLERVHERSEAHEHSAGSQQVRRSRRSPSVLPAISTARFVFPSPMEPFNLHRSGRRAAVSSNPFLAHRRGPEHLVTPASPICCNAGLKMLLFKCSCINEKDAAGKVHKAVCLSREAPWKETGGRTRHRPARGRPSGRTSIHDTPANALAEPEVDDKPGRRRETARHRSFPPLPGRPKWFRK